MIKILVFIILSNYVFSQDQLEQEIDVDVETTSMAILGLGLSGALLGLSTLSFDTYPQRNLDKISKGAAIGIVIGVFLSFYINSEKQSAFLIQPQFQNEEKKIMLSYDF